MGIFNQSSSPLSTLMPQSSPYKMPDYSNAFKINNQMLMNNLKFRTGLLTSNSLDPTTALNGNSMMNDAMNPNYQDTLLLQNINNSTTGGASFNWDLGFNALSLIGGLVGGLAGNVLNSAGKIGSSIKMISQANKGIKDGIAGASKAKAGGVGAVVGAASDLVGSFMPLKTEYEGDKGDITQTMDSIYDGISDAAMSFGPVGMLVGGIMKGGALLGKGMNALGGGTSGMTTTDAILGSSFLNLTPLGLVNGFGGKKADTITKDNEAFAQVGSSYTGSESTVNDALTKSGKKYGLLSSGARKKANELILEARRLLRIISDISNDIQDRTAIRTSMSAINGNRRGFLMLGGYDLSAVRIGRHGMPLLGRARQVIKALKGKTQIKLETPMHQNGGTIIELVKESVIELVNPDDIPEFKNGGSINVIPEGALHARKHNMDLDGITEKGIPVVSNGENGKMEQQAEIEKEEVIFRLEVTQTIEKLEKKYYSEETSLKEKDELALEAGKLITEELLHNTKDNAGLL